MESITRVVCASVCRIEGSVMDQLLAIRNELGGAGRDGGVRCAILYTSGWFLMWIEGSEAAVDAALQRAAKDPRNEHQKLLHRSRGPRGLRERVLVATTHSPLRPTHLGRWVMHLMEQGNSLEPLDIWNCLGAPCLVGGAVVPHTRPTQQFALVSAEDHGPVDQLRKIGERFASPVVYQRFALALRHTPDLGMAYVDVPVDDGAARVRVLSRRALAQPAVRRSVPQLDAMVVMLGSRPGVAVELAAHVADAVKDLAMRPAVWLAGESPEITAACSRLLERCGIAARALPQPENGHYELLALLPTLGLHPRGKSVPARPAMPRPHAAVRMDVRRPVANLGSNA